MFLRAGKLYRQINANYQSNYELLVGSGLLDVLCDQGLLIRHVDVETSLSPDLSAYKVIQPEFIKPWVFPYEWPFSQLKDAAIATLNIQTLAMKHGMRLKDASAYNIQFIRNRPVFIDTLSFEKHAPGDHWPAYRQFCQQFLGPLVLMANRDIRLNGLSRNFIDGPPLDLVSKLLPISTWLSPSLLLHLHIHARAQAKYADSYKASNDRLRKRPLPSNGLEGLLNNLAAVVRKTRWQPQGTEWADYYESNNNYSNETFAAKKQMVEHYLQLVPGRGTATDLGCNAGEFSRLAARYFQKVIAADIDPAAVERLYLHCKAERIENISPIVLDLSNPSPSIGWGNLEREGFFTRCRSDLTMSLALLHHLAISNNVPFERIAELYQGISDWHIIEFVPKDDSQVRKLLASRNDVFPNYNQLGFERSFGALFDIVESNVIPGTSRRLYLMRRRKANEGTASS